jgi:hypothetical protein
MWREKRPRGEWNITADDKICQKFPFKRIEIDPVQVLLGQEQR